MEDIIKVEGVAKGYGKHQVLQNLDIAIKKGECFTLLGSFRPKFMSNDYAFSTTSVTASGYRKAWKGAVIAADIRGELNFGNPSWAMMAKLGSGQSMRGYYEGRYRDKHKIETQLELRQHVWKRNGVVLFVGAGTVFPDFNKLTISRVLPNWGFGYRWEFKKNVNVRLDYGFGKNGESGFLFNINEAF